VLKHPTGWSKLLPILSSSDSCYRHFRFKSWYGPAIQVQNLNGLMEINSFVCQWPN